MCQFKRAEHNAVIALVPDCCKNCTPKILNAEFPPKKETCRTVERVLWHLCEEAPILCENINAIAEVAAFLQLRNSFFFISKLTTESAAQACPSLRVTGNLFSLSGYIKMGILQKRRSSVPDGGLSVEDRLILHSIGCSGQFRFAYQILSISIGCTLLFSLTRQQWRNRGRIKKKKPRSSCIVRKKDESLWSFWFIVLQMNVVYWLMLIIVSFPHRLALEIEKSMSWILYKD